MSVERWEPSKHLPMLDAWMRARGFPLGAGEAECYPPTGVVADDCAACFMYLTNAPGVAYIDTLTTDPGVTHARRRAGSLACLTELLRMADAHAVRMVMASSRHTMPLELLRHAGFVEAERGLTGLINVRR